MLQREGFIEEFLFAQANTIVYEIGQIEQLVVGGDLKES